MKFLIAAALALTMTTSAHANDALAFFLSDRGHAIEETQTTRAPTSSVHRMVTTYAKRHGLDPAFVHAIVHVESTHRCHVKNPNSSATGIMQVLVPTARSVGVTGNLRDCSTGLTAGLRYLKLAVEKFGGQNCQAASAYNRGIYAPAACTGYGRKVMRLMARYR